MQIASLPTALKTMRIRGDITWKCLLNIMGHGLGWLIATYSNETKFMIPLYIFALLWISLRSEALTSTSRTDGLVRNTKWIVDFMANEHTLSNEDEVDPSCMKGYKYWVKGEKKEKVEVIPPLYQYHLKTVSKFS